MALVLPESDSEDELPPGWEERATTDGRVFYANHSEETTQWTHPRTGKKKTVPAELPYGWQMKALEEGKVVYVDHIQKKTTYTDPRLAFAVEEKENVTDIRQKFDASSTALQVLHGRDLSSMVAVVTGANCGIGYETAKALAFHGCQVILACRNLEKANAAIARIHADRPQARCEALLLDLCSFSSVKQFSDNLKRKHRCVDILILNAAVFGVPFYLTNDGYEMTFQVNHLSQYYLTRLLEAPLAKSKRARIVVVSSESHRLSFLNHSNINEDYLNCTSSSQFVPMFAYNDTKLCNILFSNELNKRWKSCGVRCNAVHPGNMVSSCISRNWWLYRVLFALVRPFTKSLDQAASTSIYCATSVDLDGVGGMYFNNCCRCPPSLVSDDEQLSQTLWEISEQMLVRSVGKF